MTVGIDPVPLTVGIDLVLIAGATQSKALGLEEGDDLRLILDGKRRAETRSPTGRAAY